MPALPRALCGRAFASPLSRIPENGSGILRVPLPFSGTLLGVSAEVVARTIQLTLAPVAMVTACPMLANGILTRYSAVNDRGRGLTRERLE